MNRLTVEEVEKILYAISSMGLGEIGKPSLLSFQDIKVSRETLLQITKQLADTMRENERLRESLIRAEARFRFIESGEHHGILTGFDKCADEIKEALRNKHLDAVQWPTPEEMAKTAFDLQVEIKRLSTQNQTITGCGDYLCDDCGKRCWFAAPHQCEKSSKTS